MTGFEWLREQIRGQEDPALIQTVEFLLTRNDMEEKYLNPEKSVKEMAEFIRKKGIECYKNGWNYIKNELVYAWAIMYYNFTNEFLKITPKKEKEKTTKKQNTTDKGKVVSIEDAKQNIEQKKKVEQISLFGGVA